MWLTMTDDLRKLLHENCLAEMTAVHQTIARKDCILWKYSMTVLVLVKYDQNMYVYSLFQHEAAFQNFFNIRVLSAQPLRPLGDS